METRGIQFLLNCNKIDEHPNKITTVEFDYSKSFYELPHSLLVIACDFFTQVAFGYFHLSDFDMYGEYAIDKIADRSD